LNIHWMTWLSTRTTRSYLKASTFEWMWLSFV
jgi:hypothetical protein